MGSNSESQMICYSDTVDCMNSVYANTLFVSLGHCDIRKQMFRQHISQQST